MTVIFNPRVITDGLVLHLDAGNVKSYPGSGTTWTDISRNGNNGTLTNGPTYDSANGGSLSFDGSDDYVSIADSDTVNLPNLTVLSWFYISLFPGNNQYRIINHQETSTRAWGLQIGRGDYVGGGYTSSDIILFCHSNNGVAAQNLLCSTKLQINTWYQGGFSNDGTTLKIYLNGVATDTVSSLGNQYSNIASDICIGVTAEGKNSKFWNGRIANSQIYNRALTAAEIQQNFNALRGRYGI